MVNEELMKLIKEAGAPVEVINDLWFHVFCFKFAYLLVEQVESGCIEITD